MHTELHNTEFGKNRFMKSIPLDRKEILKLLPLKKRFIILNHLYNIILKKFNLLRDLK